MNKLIIFKIKDVLIPSFCYEFTTSLVNLNFSKRMKQKLYILGAKIIYENSDGFQFSIATSKLLKRLRIGKAIVTVKYKGNEFNILVKFQTQKIVYFTISGIISSLILFKICNESNDLLKKCFLILFIFLSGHLYFLAFIANNVKRIRSFFNNIGE
jgi:hypothetical protein